MSGRLAVTLSIGSQYTVSSIESEVIRMLDLIKGLLGDMGGKQNKKLPLEKVIKGIASALLGKKK
jgi:hypothetical protein